MVPINTIERAGPVTVNRPVAPTITTAAPNTAASNGVTALKTVVVVAPNVPIFKVMAFNGPAPEVINGRLAMLGAQPATLQLKQGDFKFLEAASSRSRQGLLCAVKPPTTASSLIPVVARLCYRPHNAL
jgi:hypothetical protein